MTCVVTTPFDDPLVDLSQSLRAWFASSANVARLSAVGITPPAVGITGFNQREQILNQGSGQANRVLLIPGSWPDGSNQGKLVEPRRRKGLGHRVNATWERVVTASVWAADVTALQNPENQLQAVSSLMNTTHAALREILAGDFPGTGDVFSDPKRSANISFGMELLMQFTFYCEMRAMPISISGTPVTAVIEKPA
jgi:hypothetical protein